MKATEERNLTDNAWVKRVGELNQMLADLPWEVTADNLEEQIRWFLSPEMAGEDFDEDDMAYIRARVLAQAEVDAESDMYVSWHDCRVERDPDESPGDTVIYDSDGDILQVFPGIMTDGQLMAALDMANQFYWWGMR